MAKFPLHGYLYTSVVLAIALPGAAQDCHLFRFRSLRCHLRPNLDEDISNSSVGVNSGNTITVTDTGTGTLHIVTNLLNNWNFV